MPSHGPRKKVARPLAAQRWVKDATRRLAHLRKRRQQQQQAPPGLHGEEVPPGAASPLLSRAGPCVKSERKKGRRGAYQAPRPPVPQFPTVRAAGGQRAWLTLSLFGGYLSKPVTSAPCQVPGAVHGTAARAQRLTGLLRPPAHGCVVELRRG